MPASASASASGGASPRRPVGRPKGPPKRKISPYLELDTIADLDYIREYYGGLSISDGVEIAVRDIAKLLRRVGR